MILDLIGFWWLGLALPTSAFLAVRMWFCVRWLVPINPPRWEKRLLVLASVLMKYFHRIPYWEHRLYGWCVCYESIHALVSGWGLKVRFITVTEEEYEKRSKRFWGPYYSSVGVTGRWSTSVFNLCGYGQELLAAPTNCVIWPTREEAERHLMVMAMERSS